jgi:hypothetical protein
VLLALGLIVVVFLIVSAPRISAPFGDSDEGINGAVWATNSRALREAGVVDSRLGGRRLDGTSYATHPPLIVISTAAAETLVGEHEWATRMPAWVGSIAAVVLLYLLSRSIGVGSPAAAAAVAATALTPMFFTYGFMLDTPVVSLPFRIAVLLLWHRQWRADDGGWAWPPVAVAAVCALAALAGWQAAVLVGLAAVTLLVRGARNEDRGLREALPFIIGGLIGVVASLSWTWWVYGDFATLGDKFFRRSGESSTVGVDDMVSFQIPWLAQLLGLGLAGLGACVAALWDRRARALAAMGLAIVVVYAVAFRQAAAGHQYWNYWALIPTAIGFAWAFDRLAKDLPARAVAPTLVGACTVLGFLNLVVFDDEALRYIDDGHEVAELVVARPIPDEQGGIPYVGQAFRPNAWLEYYTGLPAAQLESQEQLDTVAASEPEYVVVVLGWCEPSDASADFCRSVVGPDQRPADGGYVAPRPLVGTVADLAEQVQREAD